MYCAAMFLCILHTGLVCFSNAAEGDRIRYSIASTGVVLSSTGPGAIFLVKLPIIYIPVLIF